MASEPKFVEFKTRDGLLLPGLLYEAKYAKAAAIYLHGNGSSSVFYNEKRNRIMAEALNKIGVSILYFNNRGAHIVKSLKIAQKGRTKRRDFGAAYEKIKECVPDIDGAVSFLKRNGYRKFYLVGASTGANKICVYNFYKPRNKIDKYVLLCGGDDTGFYYHTLGKARFFGLLREAKRKIARGRGEEIVKELLPNGIFAYAGFYDIANPDGDYNVFPFYEAMGKAKLSKKPLFRYFKSIKKPGLVIYGSRDEYAWRNVPRVVRILEEENPGLAYGIIKGARHSFAGYEKKLAGVVAGWLRTGD